MLIDGKSFFNVPVKNKEEANEKIRSISKNNDCTTDYLYDCEYFSKYYKLIAVDLSRQIELENPGLKQQCFSSLRNQKKQLLNFHKIL